MTIEVDPTFAKGRDRARARRRKRLMRRLGIAAAVLGSGGLVALVFMLFVGFGAAPSDPEYAEGSEAGAGDEDFIMVQADTEDQADQAASFSRVLPADLQVDPMILRIAEEDRDNLKLLPGPPGFLLERIGQDGSQRLAYLKEPLVQGEQRLELVLPSSRDDFALFQAQRRTAADAVPLTAAQVRLAPVEAGEIVAVEEDSSWGDLITNDTNARASDTATEGAAVYVQTRIENTTSTVLALRESARSGLYDDAITAITTERALDQVLISNGFTEDQAKAIATAAANRLQLPEKLPGGSIVAVRYRPEETRKALLQMSVYGPEGYIGTLVRLGEGRFDSGADPWFSENLTQRTGELRAQAQQAKEVRLIDAIYSTAIRSGLPQTLVGQMIVILSKDFDVDRFASDGDTITVLYANDPGPEGEGLGRVLYVGIEGPSGSLQCYVTESDNDAGFACFDFDAVAGGGGGGGSIGSGLVVPVKGVKTSGFGPRHHPILKQVRNHNGVDWAAPTGTPIVSALDGTVNYAGLGGGYGNVIYVDHPGGLQTRYAHMSRFGEFKKGDRVQAGAVIGYVGTTGRSTGPHLHFELHVNGKPVDPLTYRAPSTVVASASGGETKGSEAVEALVNKIIQVESAGNARAKNPLSSATGLGQFISSTWIRMMRDYRPDLHNSMSRQELLNLRFDPALSREMVRNLAREGEAYLRARGHPIRPGTLYLCHFLGAAGAAKALSADPNQSVASAMGANVVSANPFLRGKTVGWMIDWSDRKMQVRGSRAGTVSAGAAPVVRRAIPQEVKEFKETIDKILEEAA